MKERRIFRPILAGAKGKDRALACAGAVAGITLVAFGGMLIDGPVDVDAWIFAPVGASAVLLFAVPASPLTQPWPVVGGSVLSAAVGILVGSIVGSEAVAVGLAVGLAIGVMSLTRSLHPPGGAFAITAVLGLSAGFSAESLLPLVMVAFDTLGIVLIAMAFHRLASGHSYPHVALQAPPTRAAAVAFGPEDVDSVLARMDDSFDISRQDLEAILRAVEEEALGRAQP